MDKLSLYEILAFIVPGFIIIAIVNFYSESVFGSIAVFPSGKMDENLLLFFFALLFGIILHYLCHTVFNNYKWYKKLVVTEIQEIKYTGIAKQIIPFLNEHYHSVRKHELKNTYANDIPAENLFDFAYYYLEANDKITQAKSYQGLYFLFRNIFTISLTGLIISLVIFIIGLFLCPNTIDTHHVALISLYFIIGIFITVPVSKWLKKKLAERVFGNYYADLIHNFPKK